MSKSIALSAFPGLPSFLRHWIKPDFVTSRISVPSASRVGQRPKASYHVFTIIGGRRFLSSLKVRVKSAEEKDELQPSRLLELAHQLPDCYQALEKDLQKFCQSLEKESNSST